MSHVWSATGRPCPAWEGGGGTVRSLRPKRRCDMGWWDSAVGIHRVWRVEGWECGWTMRIVTRCRCNVDADTLRPAECAGKGQGRARCRCKGKGSAEAMQLSMSPFKSGLPIISSWSPLFFEGLKKRERMKSSTLSLWLFTSSSSSSSSYLKIGFGPDGELNDSLSSEVVFRIRANRIEWVLVLVLYGNGIGNGIDLVSSLWFVF